MFTGKSARALFSLIVQGDEEMPFLPLSVRSVLSGPVEGEEEERQWCPLDALTCAVAQHKYLLLSLTFT